MESRKKMRHEREAARHCQTEHQHEYCCRLTMESRKKRRHEREAARHCLMRNTNMS